MINEHDIREALDNCCEDVYFTYNGKMSGVTATINDSVPLYQAWHGEEVKYYPTVDAVMEDKFYGGKSILDLIGMIDIGIG